MKRIQEGRRRLTDLQELRDQMARSGNTGENGRSFSPEQAHAILEARARVLAQIPPEASTNADVLEILTFSLGQERFGLATAHVHEVLRLQETTPLPGTPDVVAGLINVRGQILAVFDLRMLFGLPAQNATESTRTIIVGNERPEFAVIANAVFEVVPVHRDEVLDLPKGFVANSRELVRGVTKQALIVLDGTALLQDSRLFINALEGGSLD